MRVFRIIALVGLVAVLSFSGAVIQNKMYDNRIAELETIRNSKQTVADEMIEQAYRTDSQSKVDKNFMNEVFEQIFTFYDYDGFIKARDIAVSYNLPSDFINRFYDTSELTSLYAESMLDIICQYNSADIYLLERSDDVGYYYVTVNLDTVKYSSNRIRLGFFVAMQDHGSELDRFKSIIYYTIA